MALKFTAKDVKGVVSMNPTPSTPDGGDWRQTNSVDHNQAKKLFETTLASGVRGYALCGTTGENAGLLWEEKKGYIKTAVETLNHRGYIFAGATALGTKETIRQMRELHALGAEACFVGLPLWQTPTIQNMNDWWKDLAEACPDIPIMVYSNSMFFKTTFPNEFWQGVGKYGQTVVTNKISYQSADLGKDMDAATSRVQFLPALASIIQRSRDLPGRFHGTWTTQGCPEIYVAMVNAVEANDSDALAKIEADTKTIPGRNPPPADPNTPRSGPESEFAHYNSQVERQGWNAMTYLPGGVGPARPPYRDLPDYWVKSIAVWAKATEELRKKYIGVKPAR